MAKPYETVSVPLGKESYDILIGAGLFEDLALHIVPILPLKRVVIITDEHVAPLYLDKAIQSLRDADVTVESIIVHPGEQSKSFAVLEDVISQLLTMHIERKVTLIALGGGVVGDLTGFAASILLRGVPFIQLPTTLLAQVDSAVGGKTGINTVYGKNLVGSFYQPKLVLCDSEILLTLPDRDYLAGYAEIVKYGLIDDADFFAYLQEHTEAIKRRDLSVIATMVNKSCQAKARIVAQDEKEAGKRALLNLGHTFAHALESQTGYGNVLYHGEAVAIGMVLAFELSVSLGICDESAVIELRSHLQTVGLPSHMSDIDFDFKVEKLIGAMYLDKKVIDGALVLILASSIGGAFIEKQVDEAKVMQLLSSHLQKARRED